MKGTNTRVKTVNHLLMAVQHLNSIQIIRLEGEAQTHHLHPTISLQIVLHQQATSQHQVGIFLGQGVVRKAEVGTPAVDQLTAPSPQKVTRPSTELFSDIPPRAHLPGETR